MSKVRIAVAALSLSAAGLVSLLNSEWFVDKAMIPTKGDRPTVGFGSTIREDGSPVQMGDTITPNKALNRSLLHIQKDEHGLKRCVTQPLSQIEYDLLVDHAYQYGVSKTCSSSMVRFANQGRYKESCESHALWKKSQGRDCSLSVNWGPKGCKGVWLRALERKDKCMSGL
jgi:lysozyme